MALKDEDILDKFNGAMQDGHCQAKMYDVYFSLENLVEALTNIRNSKCYGVAINVDTAIKSVITHELIHAVSFGFVKLYKDSFKDEAYTDYFAKELFSTIWPEETYFTNYDYPFDSENAKQKSKILKDVVQDRMSYFMGNSK